MRLTTFAGTIALAATTLVPSTAAAAAPTCHGLPATIVGTGRVVGTDGADVIVTHGDTTVRAKGGDDTICLGRADDGLLQVYADDGDDYIQNRSGRPSWVLLGRGDDRFVGGPARDEVDDDAAYSGPADPGHDTISTGGGADLVQTGSLDTPNTDQVDTGPGDDTIQVNTLDGADADLDGGDGTDSLDGVLYRLKGGWEPPEGGAWVFDNRTGTATLDGTALLRWSGMEVFDPDEFGGREAAYSFLGSDADEIVHVGRPDVIEGGGGDDLLVAYPGRTPTRFDGGEGHDRFSAASDVDRVVIHADPARVSFEAPPGSPFESRAWDPTGFEEYAAFGRTVRLHGSPGPDVLTGHGCFVTLDGDSGDDRLTTELVDDDIVFSCPEHRIVALGGDGADVLTNGWGPSRLIGGAGDDVARGGHGNDVVLGGAGRDSAYGGPGSDRCRAEVRTSCERR